MCSFLFSNSLYLGTERFNFSIYGFPSVKVFVFSSLSMTVKLSNRIGKETERTNQMISSHLLPIGEFLMYNFSRGLSTRLFFLFFYSFYSFLKFHRVLWNWQCSFILSAYTRGACSHRPTHRTIQDIRNRIHVTQHTTVRQSAMRYQCLCFLIRSLSISLSLSLYLNPLSSPSRSLSKVICKTMCEANCARTCFEKRTHRQRI